MALFEIKHLTFTYPEATTSALKDINFEIQAGEFIVICGKSGCGKSTLLRQFKTVLTPYGKREGEVFFQGKPLSSCSKREQAAKIGYVLQHPDHQIVTDKVFHELAFGVENLGLDPQSIRLRVAEMASFFGIQNWFLKNVEELSGGQKQLLNLASVMTMQPEVLVLDEPTSQLDPICANEFLRTLKKINEDLGVTIVLIEHRLEEVFPMADRVLVLEEGKQQFYDTPRKVGKALAEHDLFLAMPSSVQIYNQTGQKGTCPLTVREGRNWLETYYGEKKDRTGSNPAFVLNGREQRETVVEAKDLWFRYRREEDDVVKDLSLEVKKGELYCILGGNGTGKSTTLSLLSGMRTPYRGKIYINGKDSKKIKGRERFQHLLGVLPQNPQSLFVKDTLKEELEDMIKEEALSHKAGKEQRLQEIIEETSIGHLLDMHPYDLSGGEQQRAALAKVLLLEPQILLLDEPTKGLDGFYKSKLAQIFHTLQAKGITIIMVSHDIEFCASYGETCALFFNGSIVTATNTRDFFTGNSFYTTAANRMARNLFPDAITAKDVIERCNEIKPLE